MQQPCNFNIGLKKMGKSMSRFIDLPIFKVTKACCVLWWNNTSALKNCKSKFMYHLKTFTFTEMEQNLFWISLCLYDLAEKIREGEAMACARVPLDEQQVTEPGPLGKEHILPALVSHRITSFYTDIHSNSSLWCLRNNLTFYQKQTLCYLFNISTR